MFTNKNLCVNAKCVGEILNFFSALLTVFFLPILPCNTFVTHAVAMNLVALPVEIHSPLRYNFFAV